MTFLDRSHDAESDPSQPLTLPQPRRDLQIMRQQRAQQIQAPPPPPQQPQPLPAQLYSPDRTPRAASDYGKPYAPIQAMTMYPGMAQGPEVPSPLEAYPTIARATGQIARWGSDRAADLASGVSKLAMGFSPILDLLSRGGFSSGFNAGSLNAIKIQQARLILDTERLQQQHAQDMIAYGTVIHAADVRAKADPDHAHQIYADAAEELREIAETTNPHSKLVAILDNNPNGFEAARQFLGQEDTTFREMWGGLTSLKKAAGVDEDVQVAEEWGKPAPAGGTGGGIFAAPPDLSKPPAPAGTTGTPDPTSGEDYDATLSRNFRLSPEQLRAVNEQVATGKPSAATARLEKGKQTKMKEEIAGGIDQAVAAKNDAIDRLANIDDKGDPAIAQRKLDQLRKLSPPLFREISGQGNYALDPKAEERIGDRQKMAERVRGFFPNYDPANYQTMKEFKDENSKPRQIMKATEAAMTPIQQFWSAVNKLPQHDSVPVAMIRDAIAGHITGDPKYKEFNQAAGQLARQVGSITTGSGQTRVSVFKQTMDQLSATHVSPQGLREMLKMEAGDIYAAGIAPYQSTWQKTFKRRDLVPGVTEQAWKDYSTILRADAKTGTVADDASNQWAAISRKSKDSQAITSDQARKIDKRFTEIRQDPDFHNPKSPRYNQLQHLYDEYGAATPVTPNPPWLLNPDY